MSLGFNGPHWSTLKRMFYWTYLHICTKHPKIYSNNHLRMMICIDNKTKQNTTSYLYQGIFYEYYTSLYQCIHGLLENYICDTTGMDYFTRQTSKSYKTSHSNTLCHRTRKWHKWHNILISHDCDLWWILNKITLYFWWYWRICQQQTCICIITNTLNINTTWLFQTVYTNVKYTLKIKVCQFS